MVLLLPVHVLAVIAASHSVLDPVAPKAYHVKSTESAPIDPKVAPLCADHRCQCRKTDGQEESGSSSDDEVSRGSHAKESSRRSRVYISATCTTDVADDDFGILLSKSTAVRTLILIPSIPGHEAEMTQGKGHMGKDNTVSESQLTLSWKAIARKPSLHLLDLTSVQLSCDCTNAWLAFWPGAFSEPLVNAEVLRFLSSRRRRAATNSKSPAGYKYLHIINEEPACPHNCSLTVAELFHMPRRIILDSDGVDRLGLRPEIFNRTEAISNGHLFAHCLPTDNSDARLHFAQKCGLTQLTLDTEKVIRNETERASVMCSRFPIMNGSKAVDESSATCPFLKLAPFMSSTHSDESDGHEGTLFGNSTMSAVRMRYHWPFTTRCLNNDTTIGEKITASRNDSGWLLCQETNAYFPQAALAPFIVAGPPQIMHFYVDHLAEQVHLAFYIVGYPRPQFGWHNYDPDDKWLKPNTTKGFEVILTSKPSFGYYIIYGSATFRELSMNCFKGNYYFVVCNGFGCDKRAFRIPQGMPTLMCPPSSQKLSNSHVGFLDTVHGDVTKNNRSSNVSQQSPETRVAETKWPYFSFPSPTVSPLDLAKEQENWIYIAVPFLVVVAVVTVGILTTCMFLRIIGGGSLGSHHSSTRKSSSTRHKPRPSLTEWELSPLNQQQLHAFEVNSSYVDWLHNIKPNVRVFPAGELSIVKELGEGAFGRVFLVKVTLTPADAEIAVTSLKTTNSKPQSSNTLMAHVEEEAYFAMKLLKNVATEKLEDLEREAAIMSLLDHPNIVQFFGLSCKSGSLALLFEYMEHGDLVNYLRNHSPDTENCQQPLHWNDLLIVAVQIAKGLEYLAERHLVHIDLAARNCLVGKDMTVKISDFGMTRDIYITDYYKMGTHTLVPLRWLPPESILYRKFTVESDIWSFGVLLWEIFSYGKIPWYMHSNSEVLQIIQDGKLLERPEGSPEEVYTNVMLRCWSRQPSERMTAKAARKKLEELVEARLKYCNVLPSQSEEALNKIEASIV